MGRRCLSSAQTGPNMSSTWAPQRASTRPNKDSHMDLTWPRHWPAPNVSPMTWPYPIFSSQESFQMWTLTSATNVRDMIIIWSSSAFNGLHSLTPLSNEMIGAQWPLHVQDTSGCPNLLCRVRVWMFNDNFCCQTNLINRFELLDSWCNILNSWCTNVTNQTCLVLFSPTHILAQEVFQYEYRDGMNRYDAWCWKGDSCLKNEGSNFSKLPRPLVRKGDRMDHAGCNLFLFKRCDALQFQDRRITATHKAHRAYCVVPKLRVEVVQHAIPIGVTHVKPVPNWMKKLENSKIC